MPEIAEVETVRNVLKKQILNKKIIRVDVFYPKMIENDLAYFKNNLVNTVFIDIKRRGKYLLFETASHYLISHLRMEGKYYLKDESEAKGKHEHVKFLFDDHSTLRYEDVRKFGKMHLVEKNQLLSDLGIAKQGIEANSEDLQAEYLFGHLHNKRLPIKSLLLDQSIISGLGNIYADEVLFYAGITPLRKGQDISMDECQLIVEGSKNIINKAIQYGGTTIRSYTSSLGVTGHYQDYLQVHTKAGFNCSRCNQIILKTKVGGRGTYYCPNCQK